VPPTTLPERRDEQVEDDPTDSTSSTGSSRISSVHECRMESGSDTSSIPSSREFDHVARTKEEAWEEQERKSERGQKNTLRVDPDAKRVLQLDQIAKLDSVGLGTRARREAIERAVPHRLDGGVHNVDVDGRNSSPGIQLDDHEVVVDPRSDPIWLPVQEHWV
jgi:hypothetical protein